MNNSFDIFFRQVFLGEGSLPLTKSLINRLVKEKGMPRKDLLDFKRQGGRYSVARNSIIFPPEHNVLCPHCCNDKLFIVPQSNPCQKVTHAEPEICVSK